MRLLDPTVPRAVIDAEIRAARHPRHDPARWALPLLDGLDAGDAAWRLYELDASEYGSLWLPGHAGEACHGDTLVLGNTDGGTVAAQAAWLEAHASAYATGNPSCWSRIEAAREAPPVPIVVASRSVGDRRKPYHAALVTVDGYHRALGYWRAGHRWLRVYLPGRP